jgi:pyruvate dehydrogenase E2 component (dihydrolipoamide acetyltransferase)
MPISVVMPALEMAQETGKLIAWLKKEGDSVAKGEPLLEIETDKAVMEIESPGDGVLGGVIAREGAEVPVGRTIAWILAPGETPPTEELHTESGRHQERAPIRSAPTIVEAPAQPAPSSARISPKARRLAKERGVDLSRLHGSGPEGEILASDVLAGAPLPSTPAPVTTLDERDSLSPVARLMAERTTLSWTTVPHFFVLREVDASALNEAREQMTSAIEKTHGVRPTHTDLLVALVARVLTKHPRLNSSWSGDGIRSHQEVNIGLAMAVDDGVVAPVIPSADKIGLSQIATQRRDLSARARAGKLRPSDLAPATFTISNLGMYNVDAFSAIIIPPQAAILAIGRIADRVVAREGKAAIRPMIHLTLSADHRVVDGARAAKFLDDLARAISSPEAWLQLRVM